MATRRKKILNFTRLPDTSGKVYPSKVSNLLTSLANAEAGKQLCLVMEDPNGGGDSGIYLSFDVPADYVSTPAIRAKLILDGSPSGTTVGLGVDSHGVGDKETWDADLATSDLANNAVWTGYADEYLFVTSVSLTATITAGKEHRCFFYIDDSVHTYTGNLLLVGLQFQYADA